MLFFNATLMGYESNMSTCKVNLNKRCSVECSTFSVVEEITSVYVAILVKCLVFQELPNCVKWQHAAGSIGVRFCRLG